MRKEHETRRRYREFIAAIQTVLNAEGATHVRVDESWLRRHVPGEAFLLEVPVGPEMVVPLRPGDTDAVLQSEQSCLAEGRSFARALITLERGTVDLLAHAEDIRTAAKNAILDAVEVGLNMRLAGVRFKPARASHLEDPQEGCDHVLVEVDVEMTSPGLGRETITILAGEEADIGSLLEEQFEIQASRQARLEELAAIEADLEIDDISLELLRWPKLEPSEVLDELLRVGNVTINLSGGQVLAVTNECGVAEVTMTSAEANWSGQYLWLTSASGERDHSDRVGRTLEGLLLNPIFAGRTVEYASEFDGSARQLFSFNNPRRWLYDAQTGRVRSHPGLDA